MGGTITLPRPTALAEVSTFASPPWDGVARLLPRASGIDQLRVHRVHLLEAQRLEELGTTIPGVLGAEAQSSLRATLVVRALLSRLREVCDGPLLVLKGPEAAAVYPMPWLRPYTDVDVLVPEVRDAERRLRAAGFQAVGPPMDWESLHHVQRLVDPELGASVEVHRRPKWVTWATAPTFDDLLAAAVPSATGVEGVLAPSPGHHAVLLAAHAWAERPLGRLGDLVDVAAMRREAQADADELAARYGLGRVWRTTTDVIEALFVREGRTWATRTWARHLPDVRERTVAELHVARLLEPFASLPPREASVGFARGLRQTLLPHRGEPWRDKLARSGRALRSARKPVSDHLEWLESDGRGPE